MLSVKVNVPVEELSTCGTSVHFTEARFVVHSTWKKSFVDAVHWKVTPEGVAVADVMTGAGNTKTVKALVAFAGGKPLSRTVVVNVKALPASAGPGVHVITPLVVIEGLVAGAGKSDRL